MTERQRKISGAVNTVQPEAYITPAGYIKDAVNFIEDLGKGDYAGAAMDAVLNLIPWGVGKGIKKLKSKVGRIVEGTEIDGASVHSFAPTQTKKKTKKKTEEDYDSEFSEVLRKDRNSKKYQQEISRTIEQAIFPDERTRELVENVDKTYGTNYKRAYSNIAYKDSLSEQNTDSGKYTKILANPPFKGSLNYEGVSTDLLKVAKTKKTELLFLILFLRMLKTGGRCASIVPDGVLFGSSNAHKAIRKEIVENNRLEAIISMPSGVFKPYAGVSTAVIIFTKTGAGGTDDVWFYDMQNDGYSLDDKRTAIVGSDIPDIVARFKSLGEEAKRERTEQSFLVPKAEIVANGYDLSINKYKKTVYVEETYPHPLEIMTEIRQLESEITSGLAELEAMLRE